MRGQMLAGPLAAAAAALVALNAPARADRLDDIARKLVAYDGEIKTLGRGLERPRNIEDPSVGERRLINAQVAFGVGNYDDAAILLHDFVEKYPNSRSHVEATFYLAEALFQKRDYIGAKTYYKRVVSGGGTVSKFYQQALERLVELSIKLQDDSEVADYLAKLDAVPKDQQRTSVDYVRGKYAYHAGNVDQAIDAFGRVPTESDYYFQARYFMGVGYISRGELAAAAKVYQRLVRRRARSEDERRVAILSHLALGRLHYERNQPSKAVDHYLKVPRKSDLFDDALFEVAWVYVRDKRYERALRALELLAVANPQSAMLPDVRILEGNLRIRKAQVTSDSDRGRAFTEFDKAMDVFEQTRNRYEGPLADINRVIEDHADPVRFLDQITGRAAETFDVKMELPQAALEWMRQEADVARVVDVETDLDTIFGDLLATEQTIERIERALDSPARINVFPELAEKRTRSTEIAEDVGAMRTELTARESHVVTKYVDSSARAELERLRTRREGIERELNSLPNTDMALSERMAQARLAYDELSERAQEVSLVVQTSSANLKAIEKYLADQVSLGINQKDLAEYRAVIDELRVEVQAMTHELDDIKRELTLARDAAGQADPNAQRARELRAELRTALEQEDVFLREVIGRMTGGDRARAEQLASLLSSSASVLAEVDRVNGVIDDIVNEALVEIRATVVEERANLIVHKREYEQYRAESHELGGAVLTDSLARVSEKFYQVLVRADVGVVDVAWATKEDADRHLKKVRFDEARERRMLSEEFRDAIDLSTGERVEGGAQ